MYVFLISKSKSFICYKQTKFAEDTVIQQLHYIFTKGEALITNKEQSKHLLIFQAQIIKEGASLQCLSPLLKILHTA